MPTVTPSRQAPDLTSLRTTTRAMSCAASVVVAGPPADLERLAAFALGRLHSLEQRWSRFLDHSEISAINGAEGRPVRVSDDTVRLVTALVQGWHGTEGAFDPTLLGALVGLGYAASRDDIEHRTSLAPTVAVRGRPQDVLVDPVHRIVQAPPGTALDPGGMGKGLAADLIVVELLAAGATGALVEIGGDVRVAGTSPAGAWTVAVDTADGAASTLVSLLDGGVATSTSRLRTWDADGERRHHLIDPFTLRSTDNETVSCTVIAGSAATAEAFTKIAFTDHPARAVARYARRGLAASVTTAGGDRLVTPAWRTFEHTDRSGAPT